MNLRIGGQTFINVDVPVLWGQRAVIQDAQNRVSVLDLSGEKPRLEILSDEPAPGVPFRPAFGGIIILRDDQELYRYNPEEKALYSIGLGLPDLEFGELGTRIGSNWFEGNLIAGAGVGIAVEKNGISLGAPLPPGLARLAS